MMPETPRGVRPKVEATLTSARVIAAALIVAGSWLIAQKVYGLSIDLRDWWPLVLIGIGALLIVRATARSPAVTANADRSWSEFAFWSTVRRRIATSDFRDATLTAVMGGIEVDLRTAGASSGEAVIDVFALWGGIEIKVSSNWVVSNRVAAVLGGAIDNSTGTAAASNHLIIRGVVLMGGVEIKA